MAGGADRAADAANAGSQTPAAAKAPAARSGAATPVPTLAAPAGSKPVAPAVPAPALMDLLSLEDGPPTAAPTAAVQGGMQAPAATDDGEQLFYNVPGSAALHTRPAGHWQLQQMMTVSINCKHLLGGVAPTAIAQGEAQFSAATDDGNSISRLRCPAPGASCAMHLQQLTPGAALHVSCFQNHLAPKTGCREARRSLHRMVALRQPLHQFLDAVRVISVCCLPGNGQQTLLLPERSSRSLTSNFLHEEKLLQSLVGSPDAQNLHAGDWAAWGDAQHSAPAVTAPSPATAAAPPAAQEEDGGWDAFQGGDAAPTAAATAGPPVSSPGPSADDPFAAWTSAPAAAAAPASAASAAAAAGDKEFSSAGLGSAPAVGAKHSQKRSAEDIMKMFDRPQQGLGPLPGQQAQGQQQVGSFGDSGVAQPGGMAGMTPQQMMQVSLICGACSPA